MSFDTYKKEDKEMCMNLSRIFKKKKGETDT